MQISPSTPGYISPEDARRIPYTPPYSRRPRPKQAKGQKVNHRGEHYKSFVDCRWGHNRATILIDR